VFRGTGETEITQENIQDLLELEEGDPGYQLHVHLEFLNKGCSMMCIYTYCLF
jgi:hypothetical protein